MPPHKKIEKEETTGSYLIDALLKNPNWIVEMGTENVMGVPIGFIRYIHKDFFKEPEHFGPRCYGWVKNRNK